MSTKRGLGLGLLLVVATVVARGARLPADFDVNKFEEYFYQEPQEQQALSDDLTPSGPTTEEWTTEEVKLGQVTGLGVDSEGKVHVFHRGSRKWTEDSFDKNNRFTAQDKPIEEPTHLKVDPQTGKLARRAGAGEFFMPHGLSIDHEDNVWLTDVALHQVFKFAPGAEKASLVLGKRFEPGSDMEHFCKPTDVAVASTGEIFVSDGYCNSRILKFDPSGKFLATFGQPNTGDGPPSEGMLAIPHSVALVEDWNLLCVADRENQRIQCFSAGLGPLASKALPTGTFIRQATNLGRVFAIRNLGHYLVGVTQGPSKNQLFIVNLENGQPVTFEAGMESPHDLAVGDDGTIYVGEIGPNRVLKINI